MFSKTCRYGIRAVLFLALNGKGAKRFSPDTIAEALEVPRYFLAKILLQLSRGGLVSSAKGRGGGFYLSEENLARPVIDIILELEGKEFFKGCVLGLKRCSSAKPCPMHFQAIPLRDGLKFQLENQTIRELSNGLNPIQILND
ncbi:MAG: Rrf2 family transcriptional regulator [Bacteroidetes bacterium]|nr:Rrf2 family transcriptional regulator [Bacteroidota bacterium]